MAAPPFFPASLLELINFVARRSEQEVLQWLRDIKLLSTEGICPGCGKETKLELPTSTKAREKTRFSKCTDPECRKTKEYKRRLFFKALSIFNHFPQQELTHVLQVIWHFINLEHPSKAAASVGGVMSVKTIRRIYERCRKACSWYYRRNHFKRMGGEAVAGEPGSGTAVQIGGKLRYVVEYDERTCVCVCGCVS
jgi:hypothetical protein